MGPVVYRQGDGIEQRIPTGTCTVDATAQDATLSWTEGESTGNAVLPIATYTTYLSDGSLVLI